MAKTVIVYPSGTTENSNPHVLFSGGSGTTFTIEMTTTGELLFSQDIPLGVKDEIVRANLLSTAFVYNEGNGVMYTIEQDQNTAIESVVGYSGTSNTAFTVPNFFSGMTSYREEIMINGPSNIIYISAEMPFNEGDNVLIRRFDTVTNQVTHEYEGLINDTTVKTLYYNYGGSDYVALGERGYDGSVFNGYITILNASDLTLVGRYQYNDNNGSIKSLLYSNGKLLWSIQVGSLQNGQTAYGTFDLSTNTFTTGSTQSHISYTDRQVLLGTDKVYSSTYRYDSNSEVISVGYGYYDYSNDTYTQLGIKTNPSGFNSYDVGVNNQSTVDKATNDIYLIWLYDLVRIDGSTGNVVEVTDLVIDDIREGRAIIFEMEYNVGQDNLWLEYYSGNDGIIVIYG